MLKQVIKVLLYVCGFASVIMLLPGSILLDINPKRFIHALPKEMSGRLQPNDQLSRVIKLHENQILGPESLAVFKGKVVTGAEDGYIYQINDNDLKPLIKLVDGGCEGEQWNRTKCGRPLGMKFDSTGTLFVVEPDLGVFSVENIFGNKPKASLVFNIEETEALGEQSRFLNDLTIDEKAGAKGGHVLYISDISTKFDRNEFMLILGGSDTGRIIKYDINAKSIETIADNLLVPNGLEITDDKTGILYAEWLARQVIKTYIKGPKKGESEVLVNLLPGEPDNIRRSASKDETYWIALSTARTAGKPNELDYYIRKPLLRKLLCRLLSLFGNGVELIGNLLNNSLIKEYGFNIKTGLIASRIVFDNSYGLVVEIDKNGKIVNSLHSPDSTISMISEAREVRVNDKKTELYLGSFANNFVGKISLNR